MFPVICCEKQLWKTNLCDVLKAFAQVWLYCHWIFGLGQNLQKLIIGEEVEPSNKYLLKIISCRICGYSISIVNVMLHRKTVNLLLEQGEQDTMMSHNTWGLTWGKSLALSPSTHWDPFAPVLTVSCNLSVCLVDVHLGRAQSPADKHRNSHEQTHTSIIIIWLKEKAHTLSNKKKKCQLSDLWVIKGPFHDSPPCLFHLLVSLPLHR